MYPFSIGSYRLCSRWGTLAVHGHLFRKVDTIWQCGLFLKAPISCIYLIRW